MSTHIEFRSNDGNNTWTRSLNHKVAKLVDDLQWENQEFTEDQIVEACLLVGALMLKENRNASLLLRRLNPPYRPVSPLGQFGIDLLSGKINVRDYRQWQERSSHPRLHQQEVWPD